MLGTVEEESEGLAYSTLKLRRSCEESATRSGQGTFCNLVRFTALSET